MPDEKPQSQSPQKVKLKCTCGQPDCDVEDFLAPKTEKWVKGWKKDACIVGLSILKEAASGTPVEGLRQAAGCGLTILQMVADMKDNEGFLHDLAQRALEAFVLVEDLRKRLQKNGREITHGFKVQAKGFCEVMQAIETSVKRIRARHGFVRWFMSGPDKMKIRRHRERLTDVISNFQLFMQMDLYTGMNQTQSDQTDPKLPAKPPNELDIEDLLNKFTMEVIKAAAAEQIIESRKAEAAKDVLKPTTTINAPLLSMDNATNSNITNYKSGNVTTTSHQNTGNDYSTKTINIGGGINGTLNL